MMGDNIRTTIIIRAGGEQFMSPKRLCRPKLDKSQKINLWIVWRDRAGFFILMFFPNNTGAKTAYAVMFSNDENMTYPIVVRMLSFSRDLHQTGQLIIYGIITTVTHFISSRRCSSTGPFDLRANFTDHIQLNMLLLRQFISVLPMILAAGLCLRADPLPLDLAVDRMFVLLTLCRAFSETI